MRKIRIPKLTEQQRENWSDIGWIALAALVLLAGYLLGYYKIPPPF